MAPDMADFFVIVIIFNNRNFKKEIMLIVYGMHPVVYQLVNGLSRSVYTTTFNNNKTK
jgi:hypothetical protein